MPNLKTISLRALRALRGCPCRGLASLKGKYRWPVLAVAAGIGLYTANLYIDRLPPNTDVAGLIVGALGLLGGMHGKGNAEIRADLNDLKAIWQQVGAHGAQHQKVATDVANLSKHVAAHHTLIVTYYPHYEAPDAPLPAG